MMILTCLSLGAQPKINPDGYNIFYFSNGNRSSEGTMRGGKPDGYWKTYYENGKIKTEGNRKEFLLDSVWKFYKENGDILNEITYRENIKNGITKNYLDGKLVSEEIYVKNIKQGPATYYYENKNVKRQLVYNENNIEGKSIEYDTTGKIITIEEYEKGTLVLQEKINRLDEHGNKSGKWVEFYEDGKVKKRKNIVGV